MFFDSHVHFDRFSADGSLPTVLEQAEEAGVCQMMAVGGMAPANELAYSLAQKYPNRIYASAGYDRDEALEELDFSALRLFLQDPLVKAVGETGLDYFYKADTATAQKKLFAEHLALAVEFNKPLIVHSRDADEDTLAMLADFADAWKGDAAQKGILHCFTRDLSFARKVLDLGLLISFSGILTFANADPLREVATYVPIDRLLIETDAPYLAPIPKRGNRNEPAFVVHTAKQLAQLKELPLESLAKITTQNARAVFAL
jgi:TatD DNase family protein